MIERMRMIRLDDGCDRERHDLKPRYDFFKEGESTIRKYLGEVCSRCGHRVARPISVEDMLEHGVVSPEEVRQALAVAQERSLTLAVPYPLEVALAAVVLVRTKAEGDSEETHG